MKKYLAFTIGPIFKTIARARATRELWASSYCFSYLVKKIIEQVKSKHQIRETSFIVPYVGNESDEEGIHCFFKSAEQRPDARRYQSGAGVFPDRVIFQDDDLSLEELNKTIAAVKTQFINRMAGMFKRTSLPEVQDYFQIPALEVKIKDGDNPILTIMPLLDSLELRRSFHPDDEKRLFDFFDRVPISFLAKDAFVKDTGKSIRSFETIIEVAARNILDYELQGTDENAPLRSLHDNRKYSGGKEESQQEQQIMQALIDKYKKSRHPEITLKTAHKYIAFVLADGDNIGKAIEKMGEKNKLATFSKAISEFAIEAVGKIDAYGGVPIYAGGDDLLFYAPVINGEHHIFRLLDDLNADFKKRFEGMSEIPATLSFGLSISYYKFPMYEVLEETRRLLFGVAKKYPPDAENPLKNAIACRLLKHSGQYFEWTSNADKDNYMRFKSILDFALSDEENILHSIHYKIQENQVLFSAIGDDPLSVKNFIHNSFNEKIHTDKPGIKRYIGEIAEFIPAVFQEEKSPEQALKKIYSMLRTVSFLTSTNV